MITQHPIFLTIRHNKIITHGKLKTQYSMCSLTRIRIKKKKAILMITQHPIFLTIRHNKIITHGKLKTRLFQYISYHLTINHKISTHYDTIK